MFSGWMLLWFSPNCFQHEQIHTDVGWPWVVGPSTCTEAVLFKQLSHFVLCRGFWQWTSNPATICPCSTLSAFCGCVMASIASDWLTLPCFLSLQWLKRVFSGLSAVCLHTSAGEPRAAASNSAHHTFVKLGSDLSPESLRKRRSKVYFTLFCYITLRFSPNFLPFVLPLKGIVNQMCVWAPSFPEFIPFCLFGIPVRSWDSPPGRVNKAARGSLKLPSYY